MIDETLYRETFSRLQASEKAKKEVLEKMKNTKKMRLPRVLRGGVIAAALIAALAVSAAARKKRIPSVSIRPARSRSNVS